MVRLWKEVLLPGRQRDRFGNWFTVRPRDVRAAARNAALMLSRGLPIPAVWEHQDVEVGDDADKKAAYAKHTFGHITATRINGRGALELQHEVRDDRDAEQLLKTRFVSPKVYPGYSDQQGREYRGMTIGHVASTPTPLQHWQRPFEMSRKRAIYFSYSPGGDAVADENDDKGEGGKKGGSSEAATGGDAGSFNKLLDALRETGMTIPEEVMDIAGLIIAVKASGGVGGGDADDDLEDEPVTTDAGAGGGGAPMLMSDARAKGYAKKDKEDLVRRAKQLFATGRVDKPTREKLLREIGAVQMSYTQAGDLHNPPRVIAKLEAYEELPKGSVWRATGNAGGRDMSDTRAVDPPESLAPADAAKVAEFMCAGLPPKK